ncbi:DUF3817 domain-containing protein [Cellulomonas bogoriensis]|uniref:DUF3817 domain-containing protein n=1 Tax=Cellulomonas bogoriensis TaxID=301388 RepID=UPI000A762CF3|nr:DUF3817 domain-containing protein [Cellulomonas bogoriensis]
MSTTTEDLAGKGGRALRRYRVMAWITGVMLLILVVEMVIKYVLQAGPEVMRWIEWVPFVHGWIYVVYLVTVVDLWSTMRWGYRRLVAMILGGVVPVMSFVVERRVHEHAVRDLAAVRGPEPADDEGLTRLDA